MHPVVCGCTKVNVGKYLVASANVNVKRKRRIKEVTKLWAQAAQYLQANLVAGLNVTIWRLTGGLEIHMYLGWHACHLFCVRWLC